MKFTVFILALLFVSALTGTITVNDDRRTAAKETTVINNTVYQYDIKFFDRETRTFCPGRYELSLALATHRVDLNVIADSFEENEKPCDLSKKSLVMLVPNDMGLASVFLKTSMHIEI